MSMFLICKLEKTNCAAIRWEVEAKGPSQQGEETYRPVRDKEKL